jgi:NADPH-dependent curcumin reductase CurA
MSSATTVNRRIVLARRPQGLPVPEDFRIETRPAPSAGAGQVLLRTRLLSLDPYMRGRMDEGPSYASPVDLDGVMPGQTVSVVEASGVAAFKAGDLVVANVGWQDYGLSDGRDLVRIDPAIPQPSYALGVLGMPGLTAYVGLLDIGQPLPGETVVVSAATGAVGAVVGQIARIKGCRVVGVAGGPQKCAYAREELGFDDCVDHHTSELPQRLAAACPKGIDVYFESVGGATLAAVLRLLNVNGRIPLCGLIAWYNLEKQPTSVDRTPQLLLTVLRQRLKIQGFIISDHYRRMGAFQQDMRTWLREGRVRYREQVIAGLENAPRGLIGLLQGQNFGKLLVRVAEGSS